MTNIYDGALDRNGHSDLKAAIASGPTVKAAAEYLCPSGTVDEVARKAEELGFNTRRESE